MEHDLDRVAGVRTWNARVDDVHLGRTAQRRAFLDKFAVQVKVALDPGVALGPVSLLFTTSL